MLSTISVFLLLLAPQLDPAPYTPESAETSFAQD
jgi:hypothetical protein